MTKKQKKNLKRIIIALSLFLVIKILDLILEKVSKNRKYSKKVIIPSQLIIRQSTGAVK